MRYTGLLRRALLVLLVASCRPIDAQSGADLTWTERPALTWDDFKAQPPKSVTYPSALSDTGFKYQLVCRNAMLDVDAGAFFSPSGSWVQPSAKNGELLKHEQGHYDMAELYALRLRKALSDAKIKCDDKAKANTAGEKMVGEFQRDWQNAERQYEEDTRYGTDLAKQSAASTKIAAELAAFKAGTAGKP
jgi:hypothetical protein